MYKIYNYCKRTPDIVHNLTDVKIPIIINIILTLGLSFSVNAKPNFKQISNAINEGMRKVSWHVFFKNLGYDDNCDEVTLLVHRIKKTVNPSYKPCPIQHAVFSDSFVEKLISKLRNQSKPHNVVFDHMLKELKQFVTDNNIIIKPSDKNAGVCLMYKHDYDKEVMRQLQDETVYRPATHAEYDYATQDFTDKAKTLNKTLFKSLKLNSIIPTKFKPANFYILPKLHKQYDTFPKGRPISGTCSSINKGYAMLLESELKPLSLHIPNLILDTPHLLLRLQNLKLDPKRKYMLITADINSMYLELPIDVCKRNCIKHFEKFKNVTDFPFPITKNELKTLLDLSLDYSYLEYNGELFYQRKGIQMGNSASVSVANITAEVELECLNKDEIVFNGRFIDDILMVVDITDFTNSVDEWLENTFKHNFLTFTYEYSLENVNFLDLNISLNSNNEIITSIYSKPMSKHEFVHFSSNHPKHLLKSLPYSCGMRIIRSCSNENIQLIELEKLREKFIRRGYPNHLIQNAFDKLQNKSREELLKPKSKLLIKFLSLHQPEILAQYNISCSPTTQSQRLSEVFVVVPYCNNIKDMGKIVKSAFHKEVNLCTSNRLRKCIVDVHICTAFSVKTSLRKYIQLYNA
ncbi:unnamed protein product [Orchesella dallaii]|uniref:Helix-turn-helix domain-containing protein n=1 Tax=Orchesella dallaii TaxID=48710 RepID=A0ABP1R7X3_9HEXA